MVSIDCRLYDNVSNVSGSGECEYYDLVDENGLIVVSGPGLKLDMVSIVDVELDNVVDLVTVHPDIGMVLTFCNSG